MNRVLQSLTSAVPALLMAAAVLIPNRALGARETEPNDDRGRHRVRHSRPAGVDDSAKSSTGVIADDRGRHRGGNPPVGTVEQRLEGRVTLVDVANSMIVVGPNTLGTGLFRVTTSTKIEIGGVRVTLEQVKVGDKVELRFVAGTGVVTKLQVVSR